MIRPIWLVLTVLILPLSARGTEATPAFVFHSFNQASLARFAPLPAAGHAQGDGARVQLDWTSEAHQDAQAIETLSLDGEIMRLSYTRQWTWQGLQWLAELPLMVTGGGILDQRIEDWHRWFGLPNGARTAQPRDAYQYRYQRNGVTVLDVHGSDVALGDVRAGMQQCGARGCWHALLQLPTGDEDRLLGGGLGAALWYSTAYALGSRFSGVLAAGSSVQRRVGALKPMQRSVTPFGWASMGYALTPRWALGAQLYAHAPLYGSSQIDALTRMGLQTTFGLQYRSARGMQLELGFQEDLITESSPDFVIQLAAAWGAAP